MTQTMTPERVLELIDAYGAESIAWPEEEREAAKALIAASPDIFEAALIAARQLDAALMAEHVPDISDSLASTILAAAPSEPKPALSPLLRLRRPRSQSGRRRPFAAVFASLAIGLAGGYAYASTGPQTAFDLESEYALVFSDDLTSDWSLTGDLNGE